ncbi:MAG: CPBP family intramembrane metalloprotease [Arenimonas sp.]|uniref:CPBP family intramembrane glutamic endopeptidase n=1 Tax=Arenimonas sp. TaxID=1872635 RepID=UPI0025C2F92B|nr:CPBP family intramembrane glutamic endopeptidase [Arenimonas sp.]MBW8366304.1 CPBP family intramembrane metalloprotease [Arenimonas sp.]
MSDFPFTAQMGLVYSHPLVRLVVGVVMVIGSMLLGGLLWSKLLGPASSSPMGELVNSLWLAALAMLAYAAFVRWVEKRPVTEFGRHRAVREWAAGVALGFGAITLTVAVIATLGGYRVTGWNPPSVLVPVLALAIFSGVFEEIIARGLVFRLLEQWLGSWTALALSALLFGFLHVLNPNATLLAAAAISIEAGILLGALYMLTRRLWMAIGLHMAWNFTQGGIYGIPVSGLDVQGLLFNTMQGPPLLTGGAFGAEASLPAIVICTSLGLWVLYRAHRKGRFVAASPHRFRTGQAAPAVVPSQA